MILTFEGAPATGKTTIAKQLEVAGAIRIGEVNERNPRRTGETRDWYLKEQLKRADEAGSNSGLVILDGDVFQPIWFNWMYPDRTVESWKYSLEFFRQSWNNLELPDLFVVWQIDETQRAARELQRTKLRGRSLTEANQKTTKYRGMKNMQQACFQALGNVFPGYVEFRAASELQTIDLEAFQEPAAKPSAEDLFEFYKNWLSSNESSMFS